ncbi:hypothetical protein AWM70_03795 [Paenibacillus yonginensis]|uniref:Uncharacterized protein n=1 Tax=Paenibacillus yonginensis TaxID=1462996 RepID=A0A1B1MX90_9BACL|nr:hypothetical protein AWM70_03795 [Paenibacillus yonginensis]
MLNVLKKLSLRHLKIRQKLLILNLTSIVFFAADWRDQLLLCEPYSEQLQSAVRGEFDEG